MIENAKDRALDLLLEYQRTGDVLVLQQAAALYRQVIETIRQDDPERAGCLSNLGITLSLLSQRTTDVAMLREAAEACRQATDITPTTDPNYLNYHNNLSRILVGLFEQTMDVAVLPEAVRSARNAADAASVGHPEQLVHLGDTLLVSYEWIGELAELREVVEVRREALAAYPPGHRGHVGCLTHLAIALRLLYQRTEELAPLEEAIAVSRRAVAATSPEDPNLVACRTSLCNALRKWSERTGDADALHEALGIARNLVAACPVEEPRRAILLNVLAITLKVIYERTGQLSVLREAVAVGRDAIDVVPPPYLHLATYKANLVTLLRMLVDRTKDQAIAREAVLLGQEAERAFRPDDPERAGCLAILSDAMVSLATRIDSRRGMEAAVRAATDAVTATSPQHREYVPRLLSLCNALMALYGHTDELSWLEYAVRCARDAVGTTPPDHPDRAKCLSNLSVTLKELSHRNNSAQERLNSLRFAREAVAATPPDHPDRAKSLANLADALRLRFEQDDDPAALRECRSTCAAIARMTGVAATDRIKAAQQAAELDLVIGQRRRATAMVELAVALLPQLVMRDVDRADRQHRVRAAYALAATTAAVTIAVDDPNRAVELLEQTRGLVFASTLDTRSDITELHQRAPDLAAPFDELRHAINLTDHETSAPSPDLAAAVIGTRQRDLAARRAQLNEQWDKLLAHIRQRAGLSEFLRPLPIDELRRQATDGPIVYLTVHGEHGHALIVRDVPDYPVDMMELPATVTATAVMRQADMLLQAQRTATDQRQPAAQRRGAQQQMLDVLGWTWDAVVEPVLRQLGHVGPAPAPWAWPRVRWCPVGVVGFLPLHAAGHHTAPYTDTVLDRVISSYTPTIRALAHARRQRSAPPSTVVVAVPDAPESSPLDAAEAEASIVQAFIPSATILPPAGTQTSHDTVTAALREHSVAHLACHGLTNRGDPTASRLLLHDHRTNPLTLHSVTRLRLEHAQLAYLSACSTTDNNPLQADEATHLTGAFQLAGYRSVIGTLWPINDHTATAVARDVYATLTHDGTKPPDPGLAAQALHRAVRNQRDRTPALPTRWAAYLHAGI